MERAEPILGRATTADPFKTVHERACPRHRHSAGTWVAAQASGASWGLYSVGGAL